VGDEPAPWHPEVAHAPEPSPDTADAVGAEDTGSGAAPSTPTPDGATPQAMAAVEELPHIGVTRAGRLVIERVQLVQAGLVTSVAVSLGLDGRSFEGTAEGTSTSGSLLRTVAHATLRAVEQVVGEQARFDVEHVELSHTGEDRTALVVLSMVTGRSTQRLSGASVVREDVRQAVMRAVLAAVNRRLEPIIGARAGSTS
jgi:hypothetical protein